MFYLFIIIIIIMGIGSLSRCVGVWAVPKEDKKPEDGQ